MPGVKRKRESVTLEELLLAEKKANPVVPSVSDIKKHDNEINTDDNEITKMVRIRLDKLGATLLAPVRVTRDKVQCKCASGHLCAPTASSVLKGNGVCRICTGKDPGVAKNNFVQRITQLGGKVVGAYLNAYTPVPCLCRNNHKCAPTSTHVSQGEGICKICSGMDSKEAERKFREKVRQEGGIVVGPYFTTMLHVACKCRNGHNCNPLPSSYTRGFGILCRECYKERRTKLSAQVFERRITAIGGKVVGKFVDHKTPVDCKCPNGHDCKLTPDNTRYWLGFCCKCRRSKGELVLMDRFRKLGINATYQFELPAPDNRRPFDFEHAGILFEFDGQQHFGPIKWFGGEGDFKDQRRRDIEKTRAAVTHGHRLVRIHYEWMYQKEELQLTFLRSALASSSRIVVSDTDCYEWLTEAGIDIAGA